MKKPTKKQQTQRPPNPTPPPIRRPYTPLPAVDPMLLAAVDRYYLALDQGMSVREAAEIFRPINEFLFDYIMKYGHEPSYLRDMASHHEKAETAQKVGQ